MEGYRDMMIYDGKPSEEDFLISVRNKTIPKSDFIPNVSN